MYFNKMTVCVFVILHKNIIDRMIWKGMRRRKGEGGTEKRGRVPKELCDLDKSQGKLELNGKADRPGRFCLLGKRLRI